MGKRRAWVLVSVQVLILLHILWWVWFGRTLAPLEPSESMAFAKEGIVTPGFILFALAIVFSLLFGRFFCGWGCHLLALQDAYRWLLVKVGAPPRPFRSRLLRLVPIVAFVYMFLWPFLARIYAAELHPGFTELRMSTTAFWQTFPGLWEGLLTFFLAGAYVVQLMGSKSFCAYACPYGAALAVADSFSPASIRVNEDCQQCGKCTAVCSSGVRVHEEVRDFGMVISTDCMKTLDCVAVCPNQALHYSFGVPAVFKKRRAHGKESRVGIPSWGEEGILGFFFAVGFFATEGLYGKVSFLLALAFGMVVAMFSLQIFRAIRLENYRTGPRLWKLKGRWLAYGRFRLGILFLALSLVAHSATVQLHSLQRDRAFAATMAFRNAWLRGQAQIPAPRAVQEASAQAARGALWVQHYGLLADARDPFVLAWDSLFRGELQDFEDGMQQVLEQRPGFGEVLFQLGRHRALLGHPEEAVAAWAEVGPRDPRYFDVRREMVLELDALGQEKQAQTIRDELLQRGYPQTAVQGRILPDEAEPTR